MRGRVSIQEWCGDLGVMYVTSYCLILPSMKNAQVFGAGHCSQSFCLRLGERAWHLRWIV